MKEWKFDYKIEEKKKEEEKDEGECQRNGRRC
jgi:hypothetical protein